MTNTPTTHANDLLAFLLALQSPQVGILAKESGTKLKQLGTKLALEPNDWEDIEGRLKIILQNNLALQQAYQDFHAKLQEANLTPEILLGLLPTEEEREVVLSSKRPVTFSPTPTKPGRRSENQEVINVAQPILKHDRPAEASKTLLQRVLAWLGNREKNG